MFHVRTEKGARTLHVLWMACAFLRASVLAELGTKS